MSLLGCSSHSLSVYFLSMLVQERSRWVSLFILRILSRHAFISRFHYTLSSSCLIVLIVCSQDLLIIKGASLIGCVNFLLLVIKILANTRFNWRSCWLELLSEARRIERLRDKADIRFLISGFRNYGRVGKEICHFLFFFRILRKQGVYLRFDLDSFFLFLCKFNSLSACL